MKEHYLMSKREVRGLRVRVYRDPERIERIDWWRVAYLVLVGCGVLALVVVTS